MIKLRLKEMLDEREISVYKLASLMGLKNPVILYPYYHDRVQNYNKKTLEKLCEALKCDLNDIIKYTHSPPPKPEMHASEGKN